MFKITHNQSLKFKNKLIKYEIKVKHQKIKRK